MACTVETVSSRSRILAFGSAAALVIAGAACAVFVAGILGEVLTIVLVSAGLAGALLLLFLEVGLGEERDLAREEERRREVEGRALHRRRGPRRRQLRRRPR
jgi:hypothetical protein